MLHPLRLGTQGWMLVTSPMYHGVVFFPTRFRTQHQARIFAMWNSGLPCFGVFDREEDIVLCYDSRHGIICKKSQVMNEQQIGTWIISQMAIAAKVKREDWEKLPPGVFDLTEESKDEGWI